jgi:amidohydrolase
VLPQIKELAKKHHERVIQLRRHIHAHPELSWNETNTAKLVADELRALGMEVTEGIAKNGVIGLLKGNNPDKVCIALRADMDALPIVEQNELPYKSQTPGVMHACGHDVHTANLLGAAMILSELREQIEGTIKFIFQPSEEKIPSGAEAMIKEGVLTNPIPAAIFGLHVTPELDAGLIGFCPGKFMASSDEIYFSVIGKGGHAALPQAIINPLLIAAKILTAFETVTDLNKPVVLSFGKIEGKGATNVVPERVEIAGTLRCFDEKFRAEMHDFITQTATKIATENGGNIEVSILKGYPVLINDEKITAQAKLSCEQYIGIQHIIDMPIRMGSEDFAYYGHQIPACFYRLGTGNKHKGITSGLHTPTFNIDEDVLALSTGLMAWIAVNALCG